MEGKSPIPDKAPRPAEWKIQKRSGACAVCNRSFSEGERYHSSLDFGDGGFRRVDYCGLCWPTVRIDEEKLFSLWQGKFSVEEPAGKPEAIESSRAEDLFSRLVQSSDPASFKLAYVFALLLERKKKISRKGMAERDGFSYVVYEHQSTGRAYMVQDVNIDLREVTAVQEDLNRLLAAEGILPRGACKSEARSGVDPEGPATQRQDESQKSE